MKKQHIFVSALICTALLALAVGLSRAQEPAPGAAEASAAPQAPLGTGFTYQGRLTDGSNPANGQYDLQFRLYDAASGGTLIGTVTVDDVQVSDGLFTAQLDFGAAPFAGSARYLEVGVRPGTSTGSYTALTPRQTLTPAPYALALPGLRTQQNATSPNVIGGHGDNAVSSGAYGATIGGGGASGNLNRVTDDYGTVGGGHGNRAGNNIGTTSDARYTTVGGGSLNIAGGVYATVGGGWANTASGAQATIGGGQVNTANAEAAAVGGGSGNLASGGYGTVGGGSGNTASGAQATVGGGGGNTASGSHATVGGGESNEASSNYATVGGGQSSTVSASHATVGGGQGNTASDSHATVGGGKNNTASKWGATVGGGEDNTASGPGATVGGGITNAAVSSYSTIGGGDGNIASYIYATIGGGTSNEASGGAATIGGGYNNTASDYYTTIGGGYGNDASHDYATVGGGSDNQALASYATIAGGGPTDPLDYWNTNNRVLDDYGTVGGGGRNRAGSEDGDTTNAFYATVAGGRNNSATNAYATVGGGGWNLANGFVATIPGGAGNEAAGSWSFAAGRYAHANNNGCFVWGDSTNADVACNNDNRTIFRSTGGFYIYTDNAATPSGLYLAAGGSSWNTHSDRNAKENLVPVDSQDLLARLAAIEIATWNYKSQDPAIRHVGPMAQDFNALLPGLGGEGETYINTLDADGVALAAIQGLYAQNQELTAENAAQQAQIDELEARLTVLEQGGTSPVSQLPSPWWLLCGLLIVGLVTQRRRLLGGRG